MHRDEVTTPRREPGYSTSSAARGGNVAVPDSSIPGEGALSFSPDEWQAFVTKAQAMAPYSLRACAAAHAEVVCYAITKRLQQRNH